MPQKFVQQLLPKGYESERKFEVAYVTAKLNFWREELLAAFVKLGQKLVKKVAAKDACAKQVPLVY